MKHQIEKADHKSSHGSGLVGHIKTTYDQLVRTFGEPDRPGEDGKVDAEWILWVNEKLVTIYNWKNGPAFGYPGPVEAITEWNVGGFESGLDTMIDQVILSGDTYEDFEGPEEEPEPCSRCEGSGLFAKADFYSDSIPCDDCDGTGYEGGGE